MTTPMQTGVGFPVTYENIPTAGIIPFQIVPAGSGSFNIFNGDLTHVLLVSPSPTPQLSNSIPIQPLTNAQVTGQSGALYAAAQTGTVSQATVSNVALSPSIGQLVEQLDALGLATQAWQETQNTSINGPGYGPSTYVRQVAQETNIPANIQNYGTPPYIPQAKTISMSLATAAGSPYTLLTVPTGGCRIWAVHISLSVATDTTYAGGLNDAYARVFDETSADVFANCNCCFAAPGVTTEDSSELSIGGIVISAGDVIVLDVNDGTNVTDAYIRAAVTILYSLGTGMSGGGGTSDYYSVLTYGALGNGTNDDTEAIKAAITAATPGGVVYFPAPSEFYLVSEALQIPDTVGFKGPWDSMPAKPRDSATPTPATIKWVGADIDAMITDTVYLVDNTGGYTPSSGIQVYGLVLDGSGITSGSGHGIVWCGGPNQVRCSMIQYAPGNGYMISDQDSFGNNPTAGLDQHCNRFTESVIYEPSGYGAYVTNFNGVITDWDFEDVIIDMNFKGLDFLHFLITSDVRIRGVHAYAGLQNGFYLKEFTTSFVTDCYIDNFGQSPTTGTYYGIIVYSAPFGGSSVITCKVETQENTSLGGAGDSTYYYYAVFNNASGQTNNITWMGNTFWQRSNGSVAAQSFAWQFDTNGGGTINVFNFTSPANGGHGTGATTNLINDTPQVTGTVNFIGT